MARYRIGNDMTILWTVNGRDGSALPLKDKEVHLYYTCERGRFEADFEIQETNVVAWNFLGKNQRALGDYTLSLEILQSDGKRTIKMDKCNAFSLVGRNCEEVYNDGDADINEGGELAIVSNLDIYRISPIIPYVVKDNNGIGYWYVDGVETGDRSTGESAYEYALTKGFDGTEEEFAAMTAKLPNVSKELAELSENLDKIDSDSIHITDAYGNIIATIDAEGIHTTDVEIQSGKMSEVVSAIFEGLTTKLGKEIDSDFFQVQDADGNIAFRIDSEGVHTPKSDSWIVSMILGETYIPTSTQRDENGDVQSAEIVYPDGNKGIITITSRESNGVTAMVIGYKDRVVSVTMERDSQGNVNKINIA